MTKVLICNITTDRLVADIHPHTELCVDLKLLTRERGRLNIGATLGGIITRDGEEHFTFRETQPSTAGKRNPREFNGKYITITRRDDGTLRPNFKALKNDKGFDVARYATGVANDELHGPRKEGYLRMIGGMPARRAGTPDEVGDLAEFLMSSRGRFISGADLLIDGGCTASYWYGDLQYLKATH